MQHLPNLMVDLALILCSAGIASVLFKKLKQPVVLGYILAGLLIGPNLDFFPTVTEVDSIKIWAEIGVVFLLFNLGLEFSFKKLMRLGGSAVITGLFEISMLLLTGYFIGKMMGWSQIDSLFLGGIIAISSTTIIFRSFDELGLKPKKFAGIVIGVLIIEDLVAVLLMVLLSTISVSNHVEGSDLVFAILKLVFFLVLWFLAGIFILPSLLRRASQWINDETILVIAIGLCFTMVLIASSVGFSPALGAFIMGSLLAETSQAERVEHVLKSVKDLFGAVFFVSVGMLINPIVLYENIIPVMVLTLAVIVGNTLFVSVGALLSGQPIKQSIQIGTSMSQIGEFSFIIATLGLTLGVISDFLYPIAVGVSVITTFTTPYMMKVAEPLDRLVEKWLPHNIVESINRYSTVTERLTGENHWRNVFKSYIEIVLVNVVILIAIILAFKNIIEPVLWISGSVWGNVVVTAVALLCMAPFLWMLTTRKISKASYTQLWLSKLNRGPIIVLEISRLVIGVILVAVLFNQFFSALMALGLALIIMLVSGIIFSRKLHSFSIKIENRFMDNYRIRETNMPHQKMTGLVPWDAHLAIFEIDIDSTLVGKPLIDLKLRERFGINIAMIERGNRHIMLPDKEQQLFPFDRISVIGTDEQILHFKNTIEEENSKQPLLSDDGQINLVQITLKPGHPIIGKTIHESGLREQIKSMIIGIERNGDRMLNPDSATKLQVDDILWIAGDRAKIRGFFKR